MPNENNVWAMFFTTLVGMERHPGNKYAGRPPSGDKTPLHNVIYNCACIADIMLDQYNQRYGKPTCHSFGEPSSQQAQDSSETQSQHSDNPKPTTPTTR